MKVSHGMPPPPDGYRRYYYLLMGFSTADAYCFATSPFRHSLMPWRPGAAVVSDDKFPHLFSSHIGRKESRLISASAFFAFGIAGGRHCSFT